MVDLAHSLFRRLLPLGCALGTLAVPVAAQSTLSYRSTALRFPTPTPTSAATQVSTTYNESFRFPRFDRNMGLLCAVDVEFTFGWNQSTRTTLNCGTAGGPANVTISGTVEADLTWPSLQALDLNLSYQESGPTDPSGVAILGYATTPSVQTLQVSSDDFLRFSGFGPGQVQIPFTIQHDESVVGQCAGGSQPASQAFFTTLSYVGFFDVTYTYVDASQMASVSSYGSPCFGPGGAPNLSSSNRPQIGSPNFTLDVNGDSGTAVTFLFGETQANVALSPNCALLVGPPYLAVPGQPTDLFGVSVTPVPIPNDLALLGVELFVQATMPSVGGPAFGVASPTNGLRIQIGC